MVVEVFRGGTYVVLVVRDENERVVGVMPIRVKDFIKHRKRVSAETSDFLMSVGVLPPVRITFHRNDRKLMSFVSEAFKEAERRIEERIKLLEASIRG